MQTADQRESELIHFLVGLAVQTHMQEKIDRTKNSCESLGHLPQVGKILHCQEGQDAAQRRVLQVQEENI